MYLKTKNVSKGTVKKKTNVLNPDFQQCYQQRLDEVQDHLTDFDEQLKHRHYDLDEFCDDLHELFDERAEVDLAENLHHEVRDGDDDIDGKVDEKADELHARIPDVNQ